MHLSFNVNLNAVGTGLDLSLTNHPDEQEEITEFIATLVGLVDDLDFSRNLIYKLADNLSHYSEARGWEKVTILGERQQVKFSNLYESLSYLDEDKIIALMANAIMVKRERQSVEEEQDELEPLSVIACQCGCGESISKPGGQS